MFRAVGPRSATRMYRSVGAAQLVRAVHALPAAARPGCLSAAADRPRAALRLCHRRAHGRSGPQPRYALARVVSSTHNYHAVSHRRPSWRQLHSAGGAWASGRGAGAPNTREGAPDNDGGAGAHGGEGHSKGDAGSQACTGGSAAGVRDDDVEDQAASDPDVSDGEAADASRVRVVSSTDYETVWSIPNMITMGRIVAAPVLAGLVVYEQYPVAVFGASRETA